MLEVVLVEVEMVALNIINLLVIKENMDRVVVDILIMVLLVVMV